MPLDPARTVAELKELRELTGDENGAQRVAWTETWETARELAARQARRACRSRRRSTRPGNQWWTLRGASEREVLIGGHIDSVPNGGWLDGCAERGRGRRGAAAARRGRRAGGDRAAGQLGRRGGRALRPLALRLFGGRRLDGRPGRAALSAGTPTGRRCPTRCGARSRPRPARSTPGSSSRTRPPTSSCTSSRGRCWSRWIFRSGVVLGTFGVERHQVTFRGQAAHAGSTPMDKRRDALAGAAKLELEIREIARRTGEGAVCTMGGVVTKPGIVTSVVETAECLLDQRHLDAHEARGDAQQRRGGLPALRAGGGRRGRVGADLEHRADPVRRGADRARRRVDPRGRGHVAPAAERARCTTPPRSRAPACRP